TFLNAPTPPHCNKASRQARQHDARERTILAQYKSRCGRSDQGQARLQPTRRKNLHCRFNPRLVIPPMAIETTSDSPKTHEQRAAARRCCEPPGPDGSMRFFRMQQLWDLAKSQPVKKIRLADIIGFDEVHWFG